MAGFKICLLIVSLIEVRGTVPFPTPHRIQINFITNSDGAIILRFLLHPDLYLVKLNAKLDGSWSGNSMDLEHEISPFTEGQVFRIGFLITRNGFLIHMNGVFLRIYNKTSSLTGSIDTIFYRFDERVCGISF